MIPNEFSLSAIQSSFRDVYAKIKPLQFGNIDLSKRRIINAGKSIDPFDYVTRTELDALTPTSTPTLTVSSGPLASGTTVRVGTFAQRGSAISHQYTTFYATDQSYVGWVSNGSVWKYASGRNVVSQGGIAAITGLLGTNDAGYLLRINDFMHVLEWTGSAWQFSEDDPGSGYIQSFPIAPPGGLWGICDGSTYTYLKGDGTTGSFVSPNLSTAAYLKLANAAVLGPTAASGATGVESGHTHPVTSPTGVPSATTTVDNTLAGSTVAVASNAHTHTITSPTGGSSGHTHGPGSLELFQTQLIAYFRR